MNYNKNAYFVAGLGYTTKEEYDKAESYKAFMYNPDNVRNCSECPVNIGIENTDLPCGQQNCWYSCTVCTYNHMDDCGEES